MATTKSALAGLLLGVSGMKIDWVFKEGVWQPGVSINQFSGSWDMFGSEYRLTFSSSGNPVLWVSIQNGQEQHFSDRTFFTIWSANVGSLAHFQIREMFVVDKPSNTDAPTGHSSNELVGGPIRQEYTPGGYEPHVIGISLPVLPPPNGFYRLGFRFSRVNSSSGLLINRWASIGSILNEDLR